MTAKKAAAKNILVPIDFSGDSINALEYGIELANHLGANVRLIHVTKSKHVEIPFYFKDFDLNVAKTVEDFFNILVERYKSKISGSIDYKIREGKVYREITNQAKYDDASYIIMGTHGISGFEEMWVGSNAYRVVTNAPCPVITLRGEYTHKKISKIIMPIDISAETRKKVRVVAEIAGFYGASVDVIALAETKTEAVTEKVNSYCSQVEDYLKEKKITFKRKSLTGSKADALIEYAEKEKANMIAIMTEQSENAMNLFLGPYAQQLVNHSSIPVLSVRSVY